MRSQDSSSVAEERKHKGFTRVIARFAERTSMNGPSYILSAKLVFGKVVWTILLMLALGAITFHLYHLCAHFLTWPKRTSVELGFKNLQMPAITFCNVNPARKSAIMGFNDNHPLKSLVAAVDPAGLDPASYNGIVNTNAQAQGKRKKRYADAFQLNLTTDGSKPQDLVTALEREFQRLYMLESRDTRIALGHTVNDMLISCSFNGDSCFHTNFTLFATPEYGNCYTLESNEFVVRDSGPVHSLQLVLDVETPEYLPGLTQGHGLRLDIHPQGTFPDPADRGFYVATAFGTDIGLKLTEINRLGNPYGKCNPGTLFEQKYKRKYTRKTCKHICEQERIMTDCGCYDAFNVELFHIAGTNSRVCTNSTEIACMNSVIRRLHDKSIQCGCENPCTETSYSREISTRQWPTRQYVTVMVQDICEDPDKTAACQNLVNITDKAELRENFLKIVIYFEELNYEVVTEAPEITVVEFASDIGGAMGLWIGLSLLSIFEIAQLFIEICKWGFNKCYRQTEEYFEENPAHEQYLSRSPYVTSDTIDRRLYVPRSMYLPGGNRHVYYPSNKYAY